LLTRFSALQASFDGKLRALESKTDAVLNQRQSGKTPREKRKKESQRERERERE
jgi:hypothetical protein